MKTIQVGLCAYGMSGQVFHGPLLEAHPGFKITKILERRKEVSRDLHPGSVPVRNFQEILEDPDLDLVIVNTPDHLHFEMAAKAINAGKHVVLEKPFTLRSADGEALIELSRKNGVLLSVFQNRRWDGDFLTVKDLVSTGKLGRLVDFESHFDRYRTEIQASWKDRSTGTGTLYNLGSHLVDQALDLFGMPERLYCDVRMLRDGALTDDSFDLTLHYPAFKCLLRSSYLVRMAGPRFILHGTEGSYLKWGLDPQEEELKKGRVPGSTPWGREEESSWGRINTGIGEKHLNGSWPTLDGNYMAFYDNIYEALTEGKKLEVPAEQALDVIRIIEAAYTSSKEARTVSF